MHFFLHFTTRTGIFEVCNTANETLPKNLSLGFPFPLEPITIISHFAMDLDFHRRPDLRKYFLTRYLAKSQDYELELVVYFWMCFKAAMRAKVTFFQAKNEQNKIKKKKLVKDAKKLLSLAESYMNFHI